MLAQIIRYATSHPKRVIAVWLVVGLGLSALGGLKAYSVTTDDTAAVPAQALGVRAGDQVRPACIRRRRRARRA